MPADAIPSNGDLPGSWQAPTERFLSPREKYFLFLSVVVVVVTYVINTYPLGYLRFPMAIYWIITGARYLQATRA
ncbi:MAG TPA: hypothetical protein VIQ30_25145 [Pseudonocardia sp.]